MDFIFSSNQDYKDSLASSTASAFNVNIQALALDVEQCHKWLQNIFSNYELPVKRKILIRKMTYIFSEKTMAFALIRYNLQEKKESDRLSFIISALYYCDLAYLMNVFNKLDENSLFVICCKIHLFINTRIININNKQVDNQLLPKFSTLESLYYLTRICYKDIDLNEDQKKFAFNMISKEEVIAILEEYKIQEKKDFNQLLYFVNTLCQYNSTYLIDIFNKLNF